MDARTEPSALDLPPVPTLAERLRERFRLSPINLRRWQNFKSNRRGYISFWLFLAMLNETCFTARLVVCPARNATDKSRT